MSRFANHSEGRAATPSMTTVEEAIAAVLAQAETLGDELVGLDETPGRVLAEDVESAADLPPFDKSAVDGYALRSEDAGVAPATLRVKAVLSAGDVYGGTVGEGECVKIMTGAPLPDGTDAVVMVEDSEAVPGGSGLGARRAGAPGPEAVVIRKTAARGANVCRRGEDIQKGRRVLERGTIVRAPEIAILASAGRTGAKVTRRPEAAVVTTGSEIMEPGSRLGPGQIWNSNGPMLAALARGSGCRAAYLGIARDDPAELRRLFRRGFEKDLLLVSGGVSMGDYDLVPRVIEEEGARVFFHKVRLKPGKPLLFARMGKCLVFGIPGNPVSNFVVFHLFIRPAIDRMSGKGDGGPAFTKALIDRDFQTRSDRVHAVPARFALAGGRATVAPFTLNGSADIVACARANSLIVFEPGAYTVKEGGEVKILPVE